MQRRGTLFILVAAATSALGLDACGSRTGLPDDGALADFSPFEAGPKSGLDGALLLDRRVSVPELDALPQIDARPSRDVMRNDCPVGDATLVYVVTEQNELFSFYPPSLTFTSIGALVCPAAPGTNPFSMAVDRKGKAYVVFSDGNLFQVSTATAACVATGFAVRQQGFFTFGMGFVSDTNGAAERLYVSENEIGNGAQFSRGLATIDLNTFDLSLIAPFSPAIRGAELTGTGDGRLFGFFTKGTGSGSRIVEIDKASATIIAGNDLAVGEPTDAFAFAFWGGDFWVFTSGGRNAGTSVTRFRPSDASTLTLTKHSQTIVGAGVSTCAPQ